MGNGLERGPFFSHSLTKPVVKEECLMWKTRQAKETEQMLLSCWKLGEAKAKFNDVVRLATSDQPQHVTVHGKNAVVVSTSEFERLRALDTATKLHDLLSRSPLHRLEFGKEGVRRLDSR